MQDIKTTLKSAIITTVGKKETKDKNGNPFKFDSTSVGVKFDFDPENWYNGFLFPNQVDGIKEGAKLNVEVYDRVGTNGVTYKNFRIPKKGAETTAAVNNLQEVISQLTERVKKLEEKSFSTSAPIHNDEGPVSPEDWEF